MLSSSSNPTGSSSSTAKVLTGNNMNPRVRKAEYAVRGELAIRSEKIKVVSIFNLSYKRMHANCAGSSSLPSTPHALEQRHFSCITR